MKAAFRLLAILIFSTILIACSSSGGGDDDDDNSSVTPTLPADATTITTANASTVARAAVDNALLLSVLTPFRQQGDASLSTGDVIRLVIDRAFDRHNQVASRTETENCDSGTVTLDYEETDTSASGTLSFNDCKLSGVVIDGSFTFDSEFDDTTGAYSDSGNGSLTVTANGQTVTVAMDYDESGNEISGEFSIDYRLSVTGASDVNFLLTTTVPITGVGSNVTGGEILVEGADDTRLKITVTGTNVADVFLDDGSGTFVFHSTISF